MSCLRRWLVAVIFASAFPLLNAAPCDTPSARLVSLQGSAEINITADTADWRPARLTDALCAGDRIRVGALSRAALVLSDHSVLRLDQNTTLIINQGPQEESAWVRLLNGIAHFISRVPRKLTVETPWANAAVEGTEFVVASDSDQAYVGVIEGRVAVSNPSGLLHLADGESAGIRSGHAPQRINTRPYDRIQWTVHYLPVVSIYEPNGNNPKLDPRSHKLFAQALSDFNNGDARLSLTKLATLPDDLNSSAPYTLRAALLLQAGRVDRARTDVDRALQLNPGNAEALALQTVVLLAGNRNAEARSLARKIVADHPRSAAAHMALSYACQAGGDLDCATTHARAARAHSPEDPLVMTRMAELALSRGYPERARELIDHANQIRPGFAYAQTLAGFIDLAALQPASATARFQKSLQSDSGLPLTHLGAGLAAIAEGRLQQGRQSLEVAVSLDPSRSILRSYLGKAYFEEQRDARADTQYRLARSLDAGDPTPSFYAAILKQLQNRPIEALNDLEDSIGKNGNRAVYRSRQLLDRDLAARSASLGRVYRDMRFDQLALVEGWKSLNTDPASHSAHRLLADSYGALPRHELARVSELLQSQLLQPLNQTPLQPQLAVSNLAILRGAGPSDLAYQEFNPLFSRRGYSILGNGVVGSNETLGDDLVVAGQLGRISYSAGQFHYETDGFRDNNDQKHDIYNLFVQGELGTNTSAQIELRTLDSEFGDLAIRVDENDFFADERQDEQRDSLRLGFNHAFSPHARLVGSGIFHDQEREASLESINLALGNSSKGQQLELLFLGDTQNLNVVAGAGRYDARRKDTVTRAFGPPLGTLSTLDRTHVRHDTIFGYLYMRSSGNRTWIAGLNRETLENNLTSETATNPKLGLIWDLGPATTLRFAAFQTLRRSINSNQTVEPTQVAGFNQFFDEPDGTVARNYGVAIDHRYNAKLRAGADVSTRKLKSPFLFQPPPPAPPPPAGPGAPPPPPPAPPVSEVRHARADEYTGRAYLYWTPTRRLALRSEVRLERVVSDLLFPSDRPPELDTIRALVGARYFHPSGWFAGTAATWIRQDGKFIPFPSPPVPTTDAQLNRFWLLDASLGYRLSHRRGIISLELKNLLDEDIAFVETDRFNQTVSRERTLFARFTLSF